MWTFGGIQIFTQDMVEGDSQEIARLQPLASGTVYHIFGYEFDTGKVTAVVVGSGDKNSLKQLTRTGLSYDLIENVRTHGSYYLKNVSFKREPVIHQTIRDDLLCTADVYTAELELYRDE